MENSYIHFGCLNNYDSKRDGSQYMILCTFKTSCDLISFMSCERLNKGNTNNDIFNLVGVGIE